MLRKEEEERGAARLLAPTLGTARAFGSWVRGGRQLRSGRRSQLRCRRRGRDAYMEDGVGEAEMVMATPDALGATRSFLVRPTSSLAADRVAIA